MKKLLIVAVIAAAAYVVYSKMAAEREERELWAEVTDELVD